MINKTYNINTLSEDGTKITQMKVFAYKIDGDTIRTVRVVKGVKTAKAENFTVKEFQTGLRLGSVTEA